MIVKNESAIIERCLNSVKDLVDCVSICDTGSTDNTVAIIKEFMEKHHLPGEVHLHQWQNFGHNRTLSAKAAQETLRKFNFPLKDTYLLLLDADMQFVPSESFDKNLLTDDAYSLVQKAGPISYYNDRLLRASMPWKCIGVTHEYWGCDAPCHHSRLETAIIDDLGDGGCKADKFERDIRLLTQGIQDEPNNERYLFYLALSHRCLKNYDDAIKWYKARIEKGGWKEEVWFSKFMIGECFEERGDWENAVHAYLEAYNFHPDRAEPLQKIATHYRCQGKNELAYLFAKQGARIPYPYDDSLFISDAVYDYMFDEELAISAYYTGFKEEGFTAINNLMLKRNVPGHIKDFAYQTALFYVPTLKSARFEQIVIDLPKIREGFAETFRPMNPSIQKVDDGYQMVCRTVNYLQFGGRDHKSCDIFDPTIRTKNYLIHYDKEFNLLSQHEITENLPRYRKEGSFVTGMEDCRLVRLGDDFWVTCTVFDANPNGIPQIALGKLGCPVSNKIEMTKLMPLKGPDPQRCEKNWLPFVRDGEIYLIYSCDPFIVYKPDVETGECQEVMNSKPKYDFSAFRGSAAPIEFDDGYLMIVHEVTYTKQRYYFHRLVYMDKDFTVKKISKPFTFLHQGIEYTCGMTLDHSGTHLIVPIGIEDRNAYLCTIDLDTIRGMLEPLPTYTCRQAP